MSKRSLTFGMCFLLICSIFIPKSLGYNIKVLKIQQPSNVGNENTLYVGGGGPNNYTKIQDAIDDAVYGNTVFVYDDSSPYYEYIWINESISLIGEDRDTTVIDAQRQETPVTVQSDEVKISGLTIINPDHHGYNFRYSCITLVEVNNVVISNNKISIMNDDPTFMVTGIYLKNATNNQINNNIIFNVESYPKSAGIFLDEGANTNNISGNEIYEYTTGIGIARYFGSDMYDNVIFGNNLHNNYVGIDIAWYRTKIINNTITNSKLYGMWIYNAEYVRISDNIVTNNGEGDEFDCGIMIIGSRNNLIINNHVSNNNPTGVFLIGSYNDVSNNYISDNKVTGIFIGGSQGHRITDNHISNNGEIGIYYDGGRNIEISRNNLIDNKKNAYFDTFFSSIFNIDWENNYWSDSLGIFPKIIPGTVYVLGIIPFPFFDIDWHPASEPYDIEGVV